MKSKSAKRVLSILIIFALSVATASPAIAVEPNNSHESDIQVFSAFDQFANVFPDVDDTVAAQSADHAAPSTQTGGSADYTYTITVDPLTKTGTASVDLALNIGEHVYPLTVSGDVKNVSIREDIEMVTGILCGSVDIAGKTYAVDGCLRKFSTDERINLGLSLVPPDYNTNPESNLVLFAIGTSVMTGDIADAYREYATALANGDESYTAAGMESKNLDRVTTEPSYETNATGSLTYQASSSGYTRDGLCGYTGTGGLGQKMRVYKDNVNKRFVILQNSYLGRFSGSLFPNGTYVATYIAAYQAGVRRVGLDSDVSSVTGCSGQFNQSTSNVWNLVNSIVSVVASYAGYSYIYEGLRTALGGVSGSASATWYSDYGCLHVTTDYAKRVNFDNTPSGVSITILVYSGVTGTYEAFSDLTYFVDCVESGFLVRTTTARATVTISN